MNKPFSSKVKMLSRYALETFVNAVEVGMIAEQIMGRDTKNYRKEGERGWQHYAPPRETLFWNKFGNDPRHAKAKYFAAKAELERRNIRDAAKAAQREERRRNAEANS